MPLSTSFKSVFSSTLFVTGCCIGAGMIGLPVKTALAGFVPSTIAMVICYLFTTMTGLLLLEATLWFDEKVNFATIVESTLGKPGKIITLLLFLGLFYSLSVAYLDGGGILFSEILSSICGITIPKSLGIIVCAALVASVAYGGTHAANRLNQYLLIGLVISYFLLISIGLLHGNLHHHANKDMMAAVHAIPLLLICFGYQNLVPSLTYYLNKNINHIRFAIIVGNLIPLLVYVAWDYVILGILPADFALVKNTEIVTQMLGSAVTLISIIFLIKSFSIFALLTSFIPNVISLIDFIKDGGKNVLERFIKNDKIYLAIVLVPALIFSIISPNLFLGLLDFAGGFIDVMLFGFLPALVVLMGRKKIVRPIYQVVGGVVTPILILILSSIILIGKIGVLYV